MMKSIHHVALAFAVAGCGHDGPLADAGDGADGTTAPLDAAIDAAPVAGVLFVNEVMASNAAACADPFGGFGDWVELYNRGDVALDLTGFTITDDTATPTKATLGPGVEVPAHGYKLIWCDDQADPGNDHVAFKLSASGEAFAIYTPGGTLVDSVTFAAIGTDVSLARIPDGTGSLIACQTGTCGASNGTTCTTPAAPTLFGNGAVSVARTR
jgi:hypothetical protein